MLSCQVDRLQQTHIEALLLWSHHGLAVYILLTPGALDIYRLTLAGTIQVSWLIGPVIPRLRSEALDRGRAAILLSSLDAHTDHV